MIDELAARVVQAQLGDPRALNQVLQSIQYPILRHVRSIVGDDDRGWDVVQVTLLSIARGIGGLQDPRLFRAWAFRIATRAAIKAAARERRVLIQAEHPPDVSFEPPAIDERWDQISDDVDNLPPATKIVIQMHYIDGFRLWEIAEALELSLGTVKSRLNYGLSLLRKRHPRS